MLHLYPTPSAEGIAKIKQLYLNRFAKAITDEEAYEILYSLMRYVYLMTHPCFDTHSTQENPVKNER